MMYVSQGKEAVRPTVHDVAQAAGVSLATVDRVINGRDGVRRDTVLRVEAAISQLGFVRNRAAANLAKRRIYRLVFVIPEGANTFMRRLEAEAREAGRMMATDNIDLRVVGVPPFDGEAIAGALDALDLDDVAGVAVVATEAPQVRRAIARLHDAGVPVVTLVSDAPSFRRDRYVGVDNVAAGRTAASLIGRFLPRVPGRIALVAGSMLVRDHVERRMGFEQVARAEYPHLEVLPPVEGRDDRDATRRIVERCLDDNGEIAGLYNIGAGNLGVIEALSKRPADRRPIVVAHELGPHTRAALESGLFHAVINQDPGHEVRSAIRTLRSLADGGTLIEGQEHIRIEIYLRDNLP
jgi:ABC-type sugar transport system, periplasmic component